MIDGRRAIARLGPRAQQFAPAGKGWARLTWEDIAGAMAGLDRTHEAYMRYVYGVDNRARHDLFGALFERAMALPEVQAYLVYWTRRRQPTILVIEKMCLCVMHECRAGPRNQFTLVERAGFLGMSRSKFGRHYRKAYDLIASIPAQWDSDAASHIQKNLK